MMFKEFGVWFPPYKIDSKRKFLMLMATILISNWNIYSWHRLVYGTYGNKGNSNYGIDLNKWKDQNQYNEQNLEYKP